MELVPYEVTRMQFSIANSGIASSLYICNETRKTQVNILVGSLTALMYRQGDFKWDSAFGFDLFEITVHSG